PSILPYFFSGARLAFGFGWRVSLVAETLGASSGVGYRMRQASDLIQMDQVFAWTIVQIAMMLVIETGLLKPLEQHLFRWRRVVRTGLLLVLALGKRARDRAPCQNGNKRNLPFHNSPLICAGAPHRNLQARDHDPAGLGMPGIITAPASPAAAAKPLLRFPVQ